MPEIGVREEPGAQLLSVMLKAYNPSWGNTDGPISQAIARYFSSKPLNQNIYDFLNRVGVFKDEEGEDTVDEESLYILALCYKHPERLEEAHKVLAKHKDHVGDAQQLETDLFSAMSDLEELMDGSEIEAMLNNSIQQDKETREGDYLEETRGRIENLLKFFRPDRTTTKANKVFLIPTDPLYNPQSGRGFVFGEEIVIMSHIDNPDNVEHEFLHAVINPIVEKLSGRLTVEQKDKTVQLANEKLKQDYGYEYFSLLCEELIRTYNDVVKKGESPQTYEDFVRRVSTITEEQFQRLLAQSHSLKMRCEELEITTIEQLRSESKSREYFERFEVNQLRDLIYSLYKEYACRPDKDTNFEDFILESLPKAL